MPCGTKEMGCESRSERNREKLLVVYHYRGLVNAIFPSGTSFKDDFRFDSGLSFLFRTHHGMEDPYAKLGLFTLKRRVPVVIA